MDLILLHLSRSCMHVRLFTLLCYTMLLYVFKMLYVLISNIIIILIINEYNNLNII